MYHCIGGGKKFKGIPLIKFKRQIKKLKLEHGLKNILFTFDHGTIDHYYYAAPALEKIGARRLHTIIERVLDEISFTATDRAGEKISIDSDYIKKNIGELVKDADLSKFIL